MKAVLLDRRWGNLVVLLLVLIAAGAVYLFVLQGKIPFFGPGADMSSANAKIDSVLSKYGADRESFSGGLAVSAKGETINSPVKFTSFPALTGDLNALYSVARQGQEKDLYSLYLNVALLSYAKFDLLRHAQQLSTEVLPGNRESACTHQDELDSISLDFTGLYISLNSLSLDDIGYAEKYGTKRPLDLNSEEERGLMEIFSNLSTAYQIACAEGA